MSTRKWGCEKYLCRVLDNVLRERESFTYAYHCGWLEEKGRRVRVGKRSFSRLVSIWRKTQSQMAQVLGVSLKLIQSLSRVEGYPQSILNVRSIFLLALKSCPLRRKAPVGWYESVWWRLGKTVRHGISGGKSLLFINGTICHRPYARKLAKKMKICRQCKVFRTMLPI